MTLKIPKEIIKFKPSSKREKGTMMPQAAFDYGKILMKKSK
jgi:hypothetical protein